MAVDSVRPVFVGHGAEEESNAEGKPYSVRAPRHRFPEVAALAVTKVVVNTSFLGVWTRICFLIDSEMTLYVAMELRMSSR